MQPLEIINSNALEKVSEKVKKLNDQFHKDATRYNKSPVNVLLSISSSACAALIGYTVTLFFKEVSLWIIPFLITIGGTFPLFLRKNKKWSQIEDEHEFEMKVIDKRQLHLDSLNKIIENLPKDTPEEVINVIWNEYKAALTINDKSIESPK